MEEAIIVTDNVSEMRADLKKKRRRRDFILGIIIIVLAIIGLINTLVFGINATQNLLNNTAQKDKWEELILPVVMANPVPFDSANDLEQVTLQEIGIYASLVNSKVENFQMDEQDFVIIPRSDVDKQITSLFGSEVKVQHETSGVGFTDTIIDDIYTPSAPTTFSYDEETQTYHINLAEISTGDMYIPKVISIEKKNKQIVVTVGYVLQDALWDGAEARKEKVPQIYYRYMISTDDKGNQYISSIEMAGELSAEAQGTSSVSGNSSTQTGGEDGTGSAQSTGGEA